MTTSGASVNDQRCLFGWTHYPISLDAGLADVSWGTAPVTGPGLHRGTFTVEEPADTFLYPQGFTLGSALVNGFNLGRYWDIGPQRALYVPAPMLRPGENEVVLFEAAGSSDARIVLRAEPSLG
jgi:beta-galactosidase